MATPDTTHSAVCTFKEAKAYLLDTLKRTKQGSGSQENAWMLYMPPPSDPYNEVYPNILLGNM